MYETVYFQFNIENIKNNVKKIVVKCHAIFFEKLKAHSRAITHESVNSETRSYRYEVRDEIIF